MWDFVIGKSGAGAGFIRELRFPLHSTFNLLLNNHLHYHSRLAQYAKSGCSANSLTNQIKRKNYLNKIGLKANL
jgi:hypothetical protein